MNAVIYTRVSTKVQVDEGHSLATQLRLCKEYAQKNDITILSHFEESGESAKTANRTQLLKLMKFATENRNKLDAILIYKIDRLSRDSSDYQKLKQFFNAIGITVISITENIQDSPVGRLVEGMLAGIAQFDNEVRAERSKNGMIDAVRQGRWTWKAPLGYVNGRVDGVKNLQLDPRPGYAEALSNCWSLVDAGYSETETLAILNERLEEIGAKTIRIQSLSKMFRNTLYIGVINAFGMTIHSDGIEKLVDPDLFNRVLTKLNGEIKQPNRYKKINPDYPLRGILKCPDGHRLTGSAPRGNGGRYPKYHCPKCPGKQRSYPVESTNDQFVAYASSFNVSIKIRKALGTAIQLNLEETQSKSNKQLQAIDKKILVLNANDREITNKNISGVYSDEHTKSMLAYNLTERTRLELEKNEIDNNVDDAEEILEFGLHKLENIGQLWTDIEDLHVRHRFQKWLFPAGVTYNGEVFGTSRIPLILSIKKELPFGNSLLVIPRRIELRLPG